MGVLSELELESRKVKRAQMEAFVFALVDGAVVVRNESHADADEHEYEVTVRDGVPVACTCPSDEYADAACKHRIAVAIREPVRAAAAAAADSAITDGGAADTADTTEPAEAPAQAEDAPDDCSCAEMPAGLPCWPCYRAGRKQLPGERE